MPPETAAPTAAQPPAAPDSGGFPTVNPKPIPDKIMKAFRDRARPGGTEMVREAPAPSAEPPKPTPKTPPKPTKATKPETPIKPTIEIDDDGEPIQPPETTAEEETTTGAEPGAEETAETPATDETPATEKGKKISPWRMVEQYKAKVKSLEKQLADRKTAPEPGEPPQEFKERLTKAESRVKELEDEIRYVNYQKSPEFTEKYSKPYEAAWKRATAELGEVSVTDPSGAQRPATPEDMLALVNLPLGKAREYADTLFGPFADDAMAHRKEIKALFDQQQQAISDAKNKATEWETTRSETAQKQHAEISKAVSESWEKANQDVLTHSKYGQYFTPRENDPEWNQRLAKGFELVDRAFSDANPRDPRLTPEQRRTIVERHAAVRHRAAAFGPLRNENETLKGRIAELEKELAEYSTSEAPQGGGSGKAAAAKGQQIAPDPWDRLRQGVRKYAR